MRRVGLLGGTFDPIHNGHLVIAYEAYRQISLDEVWLMVSPDPPHKKGRTITQFSHRYRMASLAAEDAAYVTPSDYEVHLPQPSYTAKTLKSLMADYPDTQFYFIIGEDSLHAIETWYEPAEVMRLTELIVAVRDGESYSRTVLEQKEYLCEKYGARIHLLRSENVDISSTMIRERVKSGESIKGLVPFKVEEYIWKEMLYTGSEKS